MTTFLTAHISTGLANFKIAVMIGSFISSPSSGYEPLYNIRPIFLFFNDPPPPEIYTLSLHDALPISAAQLLHVALLDVAAVLAQVDGDAVGACRLGDERRLDRGGVVDAARLPQGRLPRPGRGGARDRKSTRLNSSHSPISYAVFCLTK